MNFQTIQNYYMAKINKIAKQIGTVIFITGLTILWLLAMSYSIQHTLFNR